MWESKLFLTRLHTTPHDTTRHDSTELFKIFFSLLTLQLLFCKKLVGREKNNIDIDFTNDSGNEIDLSIARVKSVLDSLEINKAQGPDAINGAVLKDCSKSLSYPLHKLFNLAYNTGYLPSEWKLANVVPIHKKDDENKVVNYRPISLTSLVIKVFERILSDELYSCTHEKIDPCNSNLLTFTESIARSLHEKIGTDVIYFDFAKAFDTVSHDLILQKLKAQYKIDGTLLNFFVNYLQGRKQQVIIDNAVSNSVAVLSGVPHGSILGPLLFVLFMNDIYESIDTETNIELYTDDTKIWREIKSESDCDFLQKDIDALYAWSRKSKTPFHSDKCKVVSIYDFIPDFIKILPFPKKPYMTGNIDIDYSVCEKD